MTSVCPQAPRSQDAARPSRACITHQLQAFFACPPSGLVCAYLYGSVARDTAQRQSDVDLALLYAEAPPATLEGLDEELAYRLEQCLGWPVDLLILNKAPVDLIHRVLRDGILVYDGDRSARIRFEVYARNMYWDLLPYLRQYRRSARKGLT